MGETQGRLIATGNVAEVFDRGARVLKLYKRPTAKAQAFREAALHAAAEALGLPVPAVWGIDHVGGRWGVVFDCIEGPSFAERMRAEPTQLPDYLHRMVRLHLDIHAQPATAFPSLKTRLAANIERTERLNTPRRRVLLDSLAGLPDGDRLCHGDFHPMNILEAGSRALVIDWPDATRGDPTADCCRSYLILQLHAEDIAEPYLDAYCRLREIARHAILGWLPYVAAGRLAEEVPGEQERLLEIVG